MTAPHISHEELLKRLEYNPETGHFTYLISNQKARKGERAGGKGNHGYIQIGIRPRIYLAHRLAWFYVHGREPARFHEIDHINGIRTDNRIVNLREVTRTQNQANAGIRRDNKTGYKGICWDGPHSCWKARLMWHGKLYARTFHEFADAVAWMNETRATVCGEYVTHQPSCRALNGSLVVLLDA